MPEYKNGKIYCIRSHENDDIYIGSTTQSLANRLASHRYKMKNGDTTTSRNVLQYPSAYIELIESFPCNSKEELVKREGEVIRSMNCVNKIVAGRSRCEWKEENKQHLQEYSKNYETENKQHLQEYRKAYTETHKQDKAEYDKQYRENNKDIIREKRKQYYQQNREKLLDYQRRRRISQ